MRRAPTTHLGPRIREVRKIVGANPGISARGVARLLALDCGERAALAAVARAVRGGWVQRGDGERPGLFPTPVT